MERRLLSDLALSLFLNLLIKPLSILFIDAGVQKAVGNEAYGNYFVLLNITIILNIFLDFGINNFSVRYIAQKGKNIEGFVAQIFSLKLLLFILYAFLVCGVGILMNLSTQAFQHLCLLILIQFIIQFIAFNRAILNGQHRFREEAIVSVTDRTVLILFAGMFLLFFPEKTTIDTFIYTQLISYIIALLLSLLLLKQTMWGTLLLVKPSLPIGILKETLPYALLILLMLLYNRMDSVILQQIKQDGAYQAGIYAQGFRLLDALYMVGMIFAGMFYPVFSRMLHEKDQRLPDLIQSSAKMLIGGSFVVAFVTFLNAGHILSFIYGKTLNQDSVFVFQCLMISFACMSVNFLFGTLLTANANLKPLIIGASVGVLSSALLNIIFIPTYGVKACAVVSICTQALVSSLLYFSSRKHVKIGLTVETKHYLWLMFIGLTMFLFLLYPINTSLFGFLFIVLVGFDFFILIVFEEMNRNKDLLNPSLTIGD